MGNLTFGLQVETPNPYYRSKGDSLHMTGKYVPAVLSRPRFKTEVAYDPLEPVQW